MNCSFWADAAVAAPRSARLIRADWNAFMDCLLGKKGSIAGRPSRIGDRGPGVNEARTAYPRCAAYLCRIAASMRKGPQAEFFLADLPQPREAVRFDDQEKNDQTAEH